MSNRTMLEINHDTTRMSAYHPAYVWIRGQWKLALVGEARRKFTPVIYCAPPVRLAQIPNAELREREAAGDTTIKLARHYLRKTAKTLGVKGPAKRELKAILGVQR